MACRVDFVVVHFLEALIILICHVVYAIQEKVRKGKYLVIYQHRPERWMVGAKYMTGHEHRISGRKSQPSP